MRRVGAILVALVAAACAHAPSAPVVESAPPAAAVAPVAPVAPSVTPLPARRPIAPGVCATGTTPCGGGGYEHPGTCCQPDEVCCAGGPGYSCARVRPPASETDAPVPPCGAIQ